MSHFPKVFAIAFAISFCALVADAAGPVHLSTVFVPESGAPITGPERTYALDLPAGKTATLKDAGLSPAALLRWAQPAEARLIQTQVALTEVDFADGGIWRSARNTTQPFSIDELNSASRLCRDGRVAEPVQHPIEGENRGGAGAPLSASPGIVGCYFTCVSTSSQTYCAVGSGSCTVFACPNRTLCAYQTCEMECVP
jgi:hypothetical protein